MWSANWGLWETIWPVGLSLSFPASRMSISAFSVGRDGIFRSGVWALVERLRDVNNGGSSISVGVGSRCVEMDVEEGIVKAGSGCAVCS